MYRLCVIAVVLAAAGFTLSAQGPVPRGDFGRTDWCGDVRDSWDSRRFVSHCEIREETIPLPERVDVDAGSNGGIAVRGWDRNEVHVRARVVAYARSETEAREIASQVRLTTTGGRIRAEGPETDRDTSWSASFEIQAPRDARLALAARNGGLELADFHGTVEMDTRNGGVAITNAGGDIRGRTRNGGLSVALSGTRWEGRGLDLETRNGGITMTVPDGYSAELETGTTNGAARVDFPITVQGRLTRSIRTTLGSGGAPIRAVTTNGGIIIRRR